MADAAKPGAAPAKHEPPKELESKAAVQKFQGRAKRQPADQAEFFYNGKTMHIVFFVSSLAMLLSFLLMFRKDHVRDWKDYQAGFDAAEFEMLWHGMQRLQKEVAPLQARVDAYEAQLRSCLAAFKSSGKELDPALFDPDIRSKVAGLPPKLHVLVIENEKEPRLAVAETEEIRGDHYRKAQLYNFAKDNLGAVRFKYEEALHHLEAARKPGSKTANRLPDFEKEFLNVEPHWKAVNQAVVDTKREFDDVDKRNTFYDDFRAALETRGVPGVWEIKEHLLPADLSLAAAMAKSDRFPKEEQAALAKLAAGKESPASIQKADRDLLEKASQNAGASEPERRLLAGVLRLPLDGLKKAKAAIRRELEDKQVRFENERPNFQNTFRNLPLADVAGPTRKIRQVILENVKDQLNFTKVEKVDRCHTCHVGIANPNYAVMVDRSKEHEAEQYSFKEPFLRSFVDHATGKTPEKECGVCKDRPPEVPEPRTPHGKWSSDDAVRFTKTFMAHPRLDLYVSGSSKHPIEKFGCTICHEGDGRDIDFTRVVHFPDSHAEGQSWRRRHGTPFGEERYNWNYRELWDLPMIPTKFLQSSCRRCHTNEVELDGAGKYVEGMKIFERAGCYGCHRTDNYQILQKDIEVAGLDPNRRARRPGPPFTRIAAKVSEDWAWKWVLDPRGFRPSTRMPHFFGQSNARHEVNRDPKAPAEAGEKCKTCDRAHPYTHQEIEGVIVASMVKFVWSMSDAKKDPDPPAGLKGDVKRGELLFNQVGCAACHKSADAPGAESSRFLGSDTLGPSLAGVGSKMNRTWLYHWVLDPKKHFPDSNMPRLLRGEQKEQEAADIVEYLMTLRNEEFEKRPGMVAQGTRFDRILDDLVLENLKLKKPTVDAEADLKALGAKPDAKLRWFGRKMVGNFGCYSCHQLRPETKEDTAAYEPLGETPLYWPNIEGIGVELTGAQPFGSKHHDRLDFGFAADDHTNHHGVTFKHMATGTEIIAKVEETRAEWLHAKLMNPRVFDGGKMSSKPHDELLRMPNFGFTDHEAEQVSTFVLSFTDHQVAGLIPGAVKRMSPDEIALNRGNRVVRDSNCRACHRMSLDRMVIEWARPDASGKKIVTTPVEVEGRYQGPVKPENRESELRRMGLIGEKPQPGDEKKELHLFAWASDHSTLEMPGAVNPDSKFVYFDGMDWWYLDVQGGEVKHKRPILRKYPQEGGDVLAHIEGYKGALNKQAKKSKEKLEEDYDDLETKRDAEKDEAKKKQMTEQLAALKKQMDSVVTFDASNSGEWEVRYPPMLRTQGVKTQADWLYRFLKNPHPIRPNIYPTQPGARTMPDVNIRMPNFDFADEEAASIVRWFAVRDLDASRGDVYPHTAIPEREEALLAKRKEAIAKHGIPVLADKDKGCAGCHYVGGQAPPGEPWKHAPELANTGDRLRPRWLYAWQGDPAQIYPGTTMVKFTFGETPAAQEDGVRAMVEYLLNFKKMSSKP